MIIRMHRTSHLQFIIEIRRRDEEQKEKIMYHVAGSMNQFILLNRSV